MLRRTTTRSFLRSVKTVSASRSSYVSASIKLKNGNPLPPLSNKRPRTLLPLTRPTTTSLLFATKSQPPVDKIDMKAEEKISEHRLEPHPAEVSLGSSVRHVFEGGPKKEEVRGGLMGDVDTIKETFALNEVPRESLYLGMAGVLPYAATSLSTVFLVYDINHAHANGTSYMFSPETAHLLLDYITPIQIGYGAVIISFLGAIHWGMEYAGYGGHHGYRRFMYGVIAPAVAWPTILMPVEYALITQFLAFNFLYFADARATVKGWLPPWYSTYRFVLTFFVGASLVISLIGRGQLVPHGPHQSPADQLTRYQDSQWDALEREERAKRQAAAAAEEDEEGEGEGGKEDKEDDENDEGNDKKKK